MSEEDLINILEDLIDDEFKKFKWHLKTEKLGDTQPIKASQLTKAEREDTVDLMCQKYELSGAMEVMKSVFKKINRNDLVTKISNLLGPADPDPDPVVPPVVPVVTKNVAAKSNPEEEKLKTIRAQFIDRVSDAVLRKLLDNLLEREVITDDEMDDISGRTNRAEKARMVIDMMRRKGSVASSALVASLCEVDPCLSTELKLK